VYFPVFLSIGLGNLVPRAFPAPPTFKGKALGTRLRPRGLGAWGAWGPGPLAQEFCYFSAKR